MPKEKIKKLQKLLTEVADELWEEATKKREAGKNYQANSLEAKAQRLDEANFALDYINL